jgi:hypothetical protein
MTGLLKEIPENDPLKVAEQKFIIDAAIARIRNNPAP